MHLHAHARNGRVPAYLDETMMWMYTQPARARTRNKSHVPAHAHIKVAQAWLWNNLTDATKSIRASECIRKCQAPAHTRVEHAQERVCR